MPVEIKEFDLTLSGASGNAQTIVVGDIAWPGGELRTVILRVNSSNYTFTACEVRAARWPKSLSGVTLDQFGRPTTAINPFTQVDEHVFYRSGNFAPGAANATAAILTDNVALASRRLAKGPIAMGVQWTSSAGNAAVFRVSMEFGIL